ncbi:hypothetical protein VMCG_05658 [Cytospora schulzeri]|uniref:Xylanolytic transcriptional activator regulatory domain-containing protein n=1 Tax=Cytospora schulzeri TaxID=448051 RepID=A0A423WEM9_9PEZI|nr:hypothetical protein VMCG_05658 [Valsa malicola]
MAARLRRLEGMVREMIDEDGDVKKQQQQQPRPVISAERPASEKTVATAAATTTAPPAAVNPPPTATGGQVVQANGARGGSTTYVGATHFMAMLDDIEDLKSFFDDDDDGREAAGGEPSPEHSTPELDPPDMLIMNRASPRSRQDLLGLLPPRDVADRLVMRYFSSNATSQHIIHKPTFVKKYNDFWGNTGSPTIDMDWFALLFMVFTQAIFFSHFKAPDELAKDCLPLTPMQKFRQYRAAAGWALTSTSSNGRYGYCFPATSTCAPFLMYVETDFLINRPSQMSSYLLSSVCIRIMLKMGLHRDPSKLPGAQITPFDGEMRRRVWALAIQIDLIVSFHLGLPSMIHGIESDTLPPRNLMDEDFDEHTKELPPGRPESDHTHMTYPRFKVAICKLFGLVARQAHALTAPTYAEVMELDGQLEQTYGAVPSFMKIRPLEDRLTDPPFQVIQSFGIASLYQKSRCVLHRRYLVEKEPRKEHEYSRRTCLLAALALLEYQNSIFEATKPGGVLGQIGWFMLSLGLHDFLLAAMIVYLVIQDDKYSEDGRDVDLTQKDTALPNKQYLMERLKRSYQIWIEVGVNNPEVKKAPGVLEPMFRKIEKSRAARGESVSMLDVVPESQTSVKSWDLSPIGDLVINGDISTESQVPITRDGFMQPPLSLYSDMEAAWLPDEMAGIDWNSLESAMRDNVTVDTSTMDQWMGNDTSIDHQDITFMDPDFIGGSFTQGF